MKLQLNVIRKIDQFALTALSFQTTKSLSIEKHGKLYLFSHAVAISGNPWLVLRTIQFDNFLILCRLDNILYFKNLRLK
jgi:hypothetical protein